jgi:hypothetical protein
MIPYIGPEFIETLKSLAEDRPATDICGEVSRDPEARKGQGPKAPRRHVTFSIPSRIVAIIASMRMTRLILYLIVVCL